MRILNMRDAQRQYSKFSVPGFRSGSILKRIIACIYYFFIVVYFVVGLVSTISYGFTNATDVILTIVVELIILLILLTPPIVIGFSDYYDWHGIKLFVIVLGTICVLFTAANYLSSLFSDDYINKTKPPVTQVETNSDADKALASDSAGIDSEIVEENLKNDEAVDSAAEN